MGHSNSKRKYNYINNIKEETPEEVIMEPKIEEEAIIEQEVERGNYVKKDGYYIPTSDWRTKPIFHEWEGRIEIKGLREKRRFMQIIREGKADRW